MVSLWREPPKRRRLAALAARGQGALRLSVPKTLSRRVVPDDARDTRKLPPPLDPPPPDEALCGGVKRRTNRGSARRTSTRRGVPCGEP